MNNALRDYEEKQWSLNKRLVGIDEAGRGPLAGPLVVAGVILPKDFTLEGLDDSKKLTEKQRQKLFPEIVNKAEHIYVEIVSVEDIDKFDIYHATKKAMERIAQKAECELVLTDAMPVNTDKEYISLIKGDHKSISIAAASIIAKVLRDEIMLGYDLIYPGYNFRKHKGYPTKEHIEKLNQYGILPIHRKSYGPVKKILEIRLF